MFLTRLEVKHLRNLTAIALELSPTYNIFHGNNGSGKTSLLEAIHYLSLARSFRTHLNARTIQIGKDSFSVIGELTTPTQNVTVGVKRETNGQREMRVAGKSVSTALLAETLPIQLINHQQQVLLTSPKNRRQYLDWGLFHVEQSFFSHWQNYQLSLKQRNAAIRGGASYAETAPWSTSLATTAHTLDNMRQRYIEKLKPIFSSIWVTLMGKEPVQLHYYRGWAANKTLEETLIDNYANDIRLGYTQLGPHRADLRLVAGQLPAQDRLSQGQQKLLVYALKLAQGQLLQQETQKRCIYLIDDLPAELDSEKRCLVSKAINVLKTQVFITGVSPHDLNDFSQQKNARLFHVKQGEVF